MVLIREHQSSFDRKTPLNAISIFSYTNTILYSNSGMLIVCLLLHGVQNMNSACLSYQDFNQNYKSMWPVERARLLAKIGSARQVRTDTRMLRKQTCAL